ncbi:RHS repeat-associated core domain-containing protein [Gallibacterium anatis]|uniref:RHS repeat-associated core domain-containing protein n=4 Tax=Pasteurellaceae TaxID=712 RepID=UPI0030076A69
MRLENGKILAKSQVEFIWDGSHLVQEIHKSDGKNGTENDRTFSYIYSHPNSYEPLAQLEFAKDNEKPTACYYYHNDQIGIPRELTDEEGNACWYGRYTGWGKLKESYQANDTIHQPFRLQNQYCDQETGLHYNFFRYYEPNIGRFTQLDPIGLAGGENLYWFAENTQTYVDLLGLWKYHGNWCGPDWTGGRKESYGKERDHNGYYASPISQLDSACKQHDICYAQCRENFKCNGDSKAECMEKCDHDLVAASQAIDSEMNSTAKERLKLEIGIGLHLGVESLPDRSCPNYKIEKLNRAFPIIM